MRQVVPITITNLFKLRALLLQLWPLNLLPNARFNEKRDHATRLHLPRPMACNPQHRPDHTVVHRQPKRFEVKRLTGAICCHNLGQGPFSSHIMFLVEFTVVFRPELVVLDEAMFEFEEWPKLGFFRAPGTS